MSLLKKYTISEWLILIPSFTIILPFFIGAPILVLSLIGLAKIHFQSLKQEFPKLWPWLIFLVYAEVVAIYNDNTFGKLLPIGLLIYILYGTLYRQIVTKHFFQTLMKIFSVGSGLISCHALWTYINFINIRKLSIWYILKESSPQFRAESFFFNANYFGMYIVMGIVITLYWMTISKKWQEYVVIFLILGLNGISVILTASRMLIPTILASVFVLLWFNYRKAALATLFLGVLGLIAIIIKPTLFPRFSMLEYGFEDRMAIWSNGWEIFKMNPLTGRGGFSYLKYYYLFTNKSDMHAHQLLIDILANYGLAGLLLLTNALVPFIRGIGHLVKSLISQKELALVVAMLTVVLVHGLMDVSILWVQTGFVCLLVVCVPISVLSENIK